MVTPHYNDAVTTSRLLHALPLLVLAAPAPDDPALLAVSTPDLGPRRYTVRFRVLSVDGHAVESSFAFTAKAA